LKVWFKGGDATWWNVGFVFKAGILKDGRIFYCPLPDVRFKYRDYSKPVFPSSSPLVSNPGTRMSYMYNPVCVSLEDRQIELPKPVGMFHRWPRISEILSSRLVKSIGLVT
jgi:hypothetical protein